MSGMVSRREARLGVLLWLILLLVAGPGASQALAKGESEYKAGQQAEQRGDYDEAFRQYQSAAQAEPQNPQYLLGLERARFAAASLHVERGHQLREQGSLQEALTEYETAAGIDPSSAVARQSIQITQEAIQQQAAGGPPREPGMPSLENALGPPELKPLSREPISLRITNDSRIVFETIGKMAGINVLFDPTYSSTRVSVDLSNVSLEEALNQAALLTTTFWKPLTQNTILVVPDTAVKRREEEQQIIKTFYLSNTITPQELTEVITAIRTLLETRRIQQINSMNAIIVRDTPDKVALAEKIIRDVDKAKAEVVVDVAVLEVRRDKLRELGLSAGPGGLSIPLIFTPGGSTTSNLIPLNHADDVGSGDYSLTLPGATLNAILTDSHTKILQRPEVRASDGMKATLRIGDRVPIATGAYQPGVAGQTVSALVNTQFQYVDVGVNLDITPKIHANREITMKVRVEVSAVTQEKEPVPGVKQPVIGQRIVEHDIRLREGEVNILGGILQSQMGQLVSGIPGLSQIPLLKYLFSNVRNTSAEDEVLIVMRPHTVRMPDITAVNLKAVDVGTEGDVRLREPAETVDGEQIVPAPTAPPAAPEANPVPAPTPQPPVGPADTPADAPAVLPAPPDTASVSPEPPPPASFRLLEVKLDADSGQQPLEMRGRTEDAPDAFAGPLRSRRFLSRQHRLP